MKYPLNKLFSYELCFERYVVKNHLENLKDVVLFIRDLIEATWTVNRHYCFHLLSVLLLKRMCRHRFYVWITCYTPPRRSAPAFCVDLPLVCPFFSSERKTFMEKFITQTRMHVSFVFLFFQETFYCHFIVNS